MQPGADLKRYKEDDIWVLEFLKSHGTQVSAWNEETARSVLVDYPPKTSFYRYYRQSCPDKGPQVSRLTGIDAMGKGRRKRFRAGWCFHRRPLAIVSPLPCRKRS